MHTYVHTCVYVCTRMLYMCVILFFKVAHGVCTLHILEWSLYLILSTKFLDTQTEQVGRVQKNKRTISVNNNKLKLSFNVIKKQDNKLHYK